MLVLLLQRTLHQQQRRNPDQRPQLGLVIDEAHNVFTPSFATMLAEGRSGGLEVTAAFQYTGQIVDERVRAGVKSLLQNISIFRLREFEDARAAAALAMEIFTDTINADTEDQRRIRLDPLDITQQPNHRAVNLWLAHGIPQSAFTAETRPMEPLAGSPAATRAREHHHRQQLQHGYHPHDTGRYIQPPYIPSIHAPVTARHRTIHIDLAGWHARPPTQETRRVTVVLQGHDGPPLGMTATPEDTSGHRYLVRLTEHPDEVTWLPAGSYRVRVLVWAATQSQPSTWTHAPNADGEPVPHSVEITDEPRRPTIPAAA